MKAFAAALAAALAAVSFLLVPAAATACGTHPPAVQSRIDAGEKERLLELATVAARDADQILVGRVTDLSRPPWQSGEFGSVSLAVEEHLKGSPTASLTVRWRDRFIYSCHPSEMFHNVGFRPGGRFIVYIRDGEVVRSGTADHLRSGLLSLEEEKVVAIGGRGS